MREIKFRAWDKEEKEMRQVVVMTGDAYEISVRDIHGERYWQDYKTFELMQYTGLKDKNGKEIYEGDIVRCIGYVNLLKVRFSDGGFLFGDMHASASSRHDREIIGNIYENKELLKEVTSNAQI